MEGLDVWLFEGVGVVMKYIGEKMAVIWRLY